MDVVRHTPGSDHFIHTISNAVRSIGADWGGQRGDGSEGAETRGIAQLGIGVAEVQELGDAGPAADGRYATHKRSANVQSSSSTLLPPTSSLVNLRKLKPFSNALSPRTSVTTNDESPRSA